MSLDEVENGNGEKGVNLSRVSKRVLLVEQDKHKELAIDLPLDAEVVVEVRETVGLEVRVGKLLSLDPGKEPLDQGGEEEDVVRVD